VWRTSWMRTRSESLAARRAGTHTLRRKFVKRSGPPPGAVKLRRAEAQEGPRPVRFHTDNLEIDLDAHRVFRNGEEVRLTKTEWGLLETLSEYPGNLQTHRWLLERVWGPGFGDDVDVLHVFISQLRRNIEQDPGRPAIIATDPGIGYRWLLRPVGEQDT
jgi:DNA-binding response OmpR family regulator